VTASNNPKKYYYHGTHIRAVLQLLYDGRFMESTPTNQRTECSDAGVYSYEHLSEVLENGYASPHWLHVVNPGSNEYEPTTGDLTPEKKQQVIKEWEKKPRKPKQLVFALTKTDRQLHDNRPHPRPKAGCNTQFVWPADGISARQLWMISDYPVARHHKTGRYRLRLDALSRDARHKDVPDALNCIESLNRWRTVKISGTSPESNYECSNTRYQNSATNSMAGSDYDQAQKCKSAVYLPVGQEGKPMVTVKEHLSSGSQGH
jgi:hypothetical protein